MFCPNCGKEMIVKSAKFCFQCGFRLADLIECEDNCEASGNLSVESEADIAEAQETAEVEKKEITAAMLPLDISEETKGYGMIPLIGNFGDDIVFEIPLPLFDKGRIKHYKTYIKGTEYVLPLGKYTVRFKKDCVVYANIVSYISGVKDAALFEFQEYYKANVRNMEEWVSKACMKAAELVDWMQKKCENLLIASEIYSYNAKTLGEKINMSCFEDRLAAIVERYAEVCGKEEEVKAMRALAKNSSSRGFIGGGFGFSGAMGGIMAAEIANAGVGIARGIKSGITAIGDAMRADANKRDIFKNPENYAVLEDMLCYEADCLQILCKRIIDSETGHIHSVYNDEEKAQMLLTHAVEYTRNEDEFWKDVVQAIETCPYCRRAYEVIYCKYYENVSIIAQMKEIYKLFLLDDIDYDIDDLYKEKMKEEEQEKYHILLESHIREAKKAEEMVQKRDFKSLFDMMERGSFIAEECYISYYTQKIGKDENVQLYNSIASNAGKHRAYLCIAGICSYYGWGTDKDIEIARCCILKAAEANCSYAKAFICKTYLENKVQLADEAIAKEYLENLKSLASPTLLFYYGNALASKKKTVLEKCNESDYENTIMYLEYAEKCHVPGAKQSLERVGK